MHLIRVVSFKEQLWQESVCVNSETVIKMCRKTSSCYYSLLTVCDSSQGLIEGRSITVVSEGHIHTSRQQPTGKCESVFVVQ